MSAILQGGLPLTAFFDHTQGFSLQFFGTADGLHVAHNALLIHHELNDDRTLYAFFKRFLRSIAVLPQKSYPGLGAALIGSVFLYRDPRNGIVFTFHGSCQETRAVAIRRRDRSRIIVRNACLISGSQSRVVHLLIRVRSFILIDLVIPHDAGNGSIDSGHLLWRWLVRGRRQCRQHDSFFHGWGWLDQDSGPQELTPECRWLFQPPRQYIAEDQQETKR